VRRIFFGFLGKRTNYSHFSAIHVFLSVSLHMSHAADGVAVATEWNYSDSRLEVCKFISISISISLLFFFLSKKRKLPSLII
jgi:hypothetical protein